MFFRWVFPTFILVIGIVLTISGLVSGNLNSLFWGLAVDALGIAMYFVGRLIVKR
jgi:hypothetical protein